MTGIVYPAIVMGGLGLIFGALLAFASKKFYVEMDSRQADIRALLPGANCGGCGFPGCDGFAQALVNGDGKITACAAGGSALAESLAAILGAIHQTFDGQDLYPGIEEKAAHLLYFIIKDHPFTDGNKRIGSFLFLLFLQTNGLIDTFRFDNKALVALALLIAASDPAQKQLMIRLIVNLLTEESTAIAKGKSND